MTCEICGRGACTRSFHSIEDQERFDAKSAMSGDVDDLRDEVFALRAKLAEEIAISNQRGEKIDDLLADMAALSAQLTEAQAKVAELETENSELNNALTITLSDLKDSDTALRESRAYDRESGRLLAEAIAKIEAAGINK